ncbi:HNH endonuclease [Modicisalibacter luteus]|uniref:HNH endonuclease n=1 Tax=Modicisalibacter luteus TaxID=453962 RepID=A0ABV7LWI5_9GAMM|nr:HNH endonuclease [Halomonas lutea]GHB11442.1 hypothetical protein GCM10007159_37000 [Halomonas lutea]
MRNKPWTRDELILGLDLYYKIAPSQYHRTEPKIIELSQLLAAIPALDGEFRNENYRSPSGVAMKLANIAYIDPDRSGGLRGGGSLDRQVFEEFSIDQERLREIATAIRKALESDEPLPPPTGNEDDEGTEEATEGRILTRQHKQRERNRKLVKRKKAKVLKEKGTLACEACHFDFEAAYGPHGAGFIECHHTQPLHTLTPGSKTKLEDLALLCANCHRMVHAKRPWLTMDQLKKLVQPGNE